MRPMIGRIARVFAGVVVLFVMAGVGGYLGEVCFTGSIFLNKMETVAGKTGLTVGVLVAAILLRRYLLRSWGLVLACLTTVEIIVSVVILQVSGLWDFWNPVSLRFCAGCLFGATWNVVAAFALGSGIGGLWDRWSRSHHPHRMASLTRHLGTCKNLMTPEELEKVRERC